MACGLTRSISRTIEAFFFLYHIQNTKAILQIKTMLVKGYFFDWGGDCRDFEPRARSRCFHYRFSRYLPIGKRGKKPVKLESISLAAKLNGRKNSLVPELHWTTRAFKIVTVRFTINKRKIQRLHVEKELILTEVVFIPWNIAHFTNDIGISRWSARGWGWGD